MGRVVKNRPTSRAAREVSPTSKSEPVFVFAVVIFLVIAIWSIYGQTLGHDFVNYDDDQYIRQNAVVTSGLSMRNVEWAFTNVVAANWHPLTILSHMLDCQFYGRWAGGHHLTNVLLHAAAAIALFFVLRQLTGAVWCSGIVAALFALHPLHVESVAWISERKDVLSALLFVLTLGAYARFVRGRAIGWYVVVILLFAGGLMAKAMLVTVPFVLLLLDYWPLGRFSSFNKLIPLLLEKTPLFVCAALAIAGTLLAQQHAIGGIVSLTLWERIANSFVSIVTYVGEFFWPSNLSPFYPHPRHNLSILLAIIAGLGVLGVSLGAVLARARLPYVFTGWFWYVGMLVPVLGLVQVGTQAHADRYTYLPQIGLYIAIVFTCSEFILRRHRALSAFAFVVLIALIIAARHQCSFWHDSVALWSRALAVSKDNDTAHVGLANELLARGLPNEAVAHCREATEIRPENMDAQAMLAVALTRTGQPAEALTHFRIVLNVNPKRPRLHYNIGVLYQQQGRWAEAITEYRAELEVQPESVEAHNNLGVSLTNIGQYDEALAEFRKVLALNPRVPKVNYNIGHILLQRGDVDGATAAFEQELKMDNRSPDAHNDLGIIFLQSGRINEAIAQWETTLALNPDDLNARCNLAWVLSTSVDPGIRNGPRAVELARQAIAQSRGNQPRILRVLAAALAETGDFDQAIAVAQRAYEVATTAGDAKQADSLQRTIDLLQQRTPIRDATSNK